MALSFKINCTLGLVGVCMNKSPKSASLICNLQMAGVTGLEPAASGVTGQRSNQLSYTPALSQMRWICLMQLARSVNYSIRQSVELTKLLEKELRGPSVTFNPI